MTHHRAPPHPPCLAPSRRSSNTLPPTVRLSEAFWAHATRCPPPSGPEAAGGKEMRPHAGSSGVTMILGTVSHLRAFLWIQTCRDQMNE